MRACFPETRRSGSTRTTSFSDERPIPAVLLWTSCSSWGEPSPAAMRSLIMSWSPIGSGVRGQRRRSAAGLRALELRGELAAGPGDLHVSSFSREELHVHARAQDVEVPECLVHDELRSPPRLLGGAAVIAEARDRRDEPEPEEDE